LQITDLENQSRVLKYKKHSMAAQESSDGLDSQFVYGCQIPSLFSADAFRSVVNYKPRPDDVFVVTYPKCGTTWTQHTLTLIFRHGEPIESHMDFFTAAPFLEVTGAKGAEEMPRPGVLKMHLPFHLTPWSDQAKYIYVTRNPKDCCVSYFHHMKNLRGRMFHGTFDQFFELFLSGKVDYGDYFDHLMEWYKHRNDPNVLFVTYEEMKANPEAAVLKIASFVDDEKYAKPLREDPQKLRNVLKYSSFKHMKETVNKGMDEIWQMSQEEIMNSALPEGMKKAFARMPKPEEGKEAKKPSSVNFVRKGIVGDWRNHFSEDQSKRLDEKFADRTKDTDLGAIWKDYM
ncbi:sulfotransferase 1C4, partial [Caerostris darwini]